MDLIGAILFLLFNITYHKHTAERLNQRLGGLFMENSELITKALNCINTLSNLSPMLLLKKVRCRLMIRKHQIHQTKTKVVCSTLQNSVIELQPRVEKIKLMIYCADG